MGNKLTPLFDGPYVVIEVLSPNVKITKNSKEVVTHKNRTKSYFK